MTDHWKGDFRVNFVLYGAMMTTMILVVALGLPIRSKSEQMRYEHCVGRNHDDDNNSNNGDDENGTNTDHPEPKTLFLVLFRLQVVIWLVQVILIGTGMALVDSFLFVYLQNDLHASTQLCGLTVGVTVLWELPIFYYSKTLLRTAGHDFLFVISMVAYFIRAFGYTWLTPSTVHWVLALEVLHGITFACMWIASIDFSATLAPPEWSTTVQTILSASFGCFGCVVGSVVGGWVMQTYSAIILYRGMGWIMLAVLVLHLLAWLGCGQGHDAFLDSIQTQDIANERLLVDGSYRHNLSDETQVESQLPIDLPDSESVDTG